MKHILLLTLLAGSAFAATITVTLANPVQSGISGSTVNFTGTLTNTTATTQFINSDSLTINTLVGNDSMFFLNAPIFVAATQTSASFLMFSVMIPGGTAAGPYLGSFHVLGGATANDFNDLGASTFTVNVTANTPEPAAWVLLVPALGGVLLKRRRAV